MWNSATLRPLLAMLGCEGTPVLGDPGRRGRERLAQPAVAHEAAERRVVRIGRLGQEHLGSECLAVELVGHPGREGLVGIRCQLAHLSIQIMRMGKHGTRQT